MNIRRGSMLMPLTFLILALIALTGIVSAAEPGFTEFIMVFKAPVSDATYSQARTDVESAGGHVKYEYRSALKGMAVELPANDDSSSTSSASAFESKPYVQSMERSQEARAMS
ncbi:hypothetical protein BDB00DRAFT_847244 [Zychaea mexicana]|uniref:uncharacterized protein n=1 Tax=Zychaea mexicana TaxID=64656 RepID=UPI0022FE1A8B|nr:uncharacterized protein BDB00DRAFT_847244 [Zychaea mexicana]KAI9488645.1 hypothetical protein BDB00DRAFT_847244 [Zychaea mexicana]